MIIRTLSVRLQAGSILNFSPKPLTMSPLESPSSYATLPFKTIRLSHHPASSPAPTPVIILTLHRPGKNNAFMPEMRDELIRAYSLFDIDDRVKCIVFTGQGKMFCAGADLDIGFRKNPEGLKNHRDG